MKADRRQPFTAMVLSTAGTVWQDKDKHMSCALGKLAEGCVCSKQVCLELIVSVCSMGGQRSGNALLMMGGRQVADTI